MLSLALTGLLILYYNKEYSEIQKSYERKILSNGISINISATNKDP